MQKALHSKEQVRMRRLLKTVRQNANLTQAQLATKLHVPQSFVSKYESGERRLDLVELNAICLALGISIVSFVKSFGEACDEAR
jgi:transcriptional regulator with XRE-family HTH domain